MLNAWKGRRTILVVGGGFTGTLFALAAAARKELQVILIERAAQAGPGLAYGACDAGHMLNVPVARMEVGLSPSFADWLVAGGHDIAEAVDEASGELSNAFVSRRLFGLYLADLLDRAVACEQATLTRVRGEVVRVEEAPVPGVLLADGRRLEGDAILLATGNLPPKPPRGGDAWFYDTPGFVPDPWVSPELAALDADAPVLLIGTGLTMVDVALKLAARGHRGPLVAVSRHGLLPHVHLAPAVNAGLAGPPTPVLDPEVATTPLKALVQLRAAVRQAEAAGIPWQKVMDAVRPGIAGVWSRWTLADKARFLRHARTLWDVHRHRMAPRIAARLDALRAAGRLRLVAGRIAGFSRAAGGATVSVRRRRSGEEVAFDAALVVNCTGPRSDFAEIGVPPFEALRRAGRLVPDPLGLGVETRGCALVDRFGSVSSALFAIGPLTRPAWWEITAVPEISAQVHRLVDDFTRQTVPGRPGSSRPFVPSDPATLLGDFVNLGDGI